jgi:hypothetical protein
VDATGREVQSQIGASVRLLAVSQWEHFVETTVSVISKEIRAVVQRHRDGLVADEEDFTSKMLGRIESRLDGTQIDGLRWDARVLKKTVEEPHVGADLLGVLTSRADEFRIDKGFLAQAKLYGHHRKPARKKLLAQCEAMLAHSGASYVFLYRLDGVFVVPALAVVAAAGDVHGLETWSIEDFFREHLWCFVGDRRLSSLFPFPAEFGREGVLDPEAPARRALALRVTETPGRSAVQGEG